MEKEKTLSGTTGTSNTLHSFLAMIPRGLEHEVSAMVKDKIPGVELSIVGQGDTFSHDIGLQTRKALIAHQQRKQKDWNSWFARPIGSVELSRAQHVSVGYSNAELCTWSCPGTLEGSVWMNIRIPRSKIREFSSLRCLGPVLALVGLTDDIPSLKNRDHEMDELLKDISDWMGSIGQDKFGHNLASAIDLWKEYVALVWPAMLQKDEQSSLKERIEQDRLRFRLSGMRDHEDAPYARHDFLRRLIDDLGSTLLPSYHGIGAEQGWCVNLKQFDIEFVTVWLSNGFMAMGISLLPYSFLQATSFDKGGVPPDISKPYIGGALKDLVRLRPTTAHLLLRIATVQPFEVVIDPCAGVGTIPLEADVFLGQCIGIGGDVVLNRPTMAATASSLEQVARDSNRTAASSLLAAWDASHLPVRDCSIDICVSDLPFGKQCLSSNSVRQLLPLLFLECSRILTVDVGRMVLLCGSPSIAESLKESEKYWKQPCTVATPVNIGGLQAWVIRIERNGIHYDSIDHPKRLDRVRRLARKRDMVDKQQEGSGIKANTKKRRTQP
jgi:Putative RNA methylase family UPF0020